MALVTGAGRGIGREIALTLAANGATVIVNYNGSKECAEAVVAEIVQRGGSAEAVTCISPLISFPTLYPNLPISLHLCILHLY